MRKNGIEEDWLDENYEKSVPNVASPYLPAASNEEKGVQRSSEHGTPYGTLPHEDSIRVLRVEPGDSHLALDCSLETVRLSKLDYSYEAISYAWGDISKPKHIKIGQGSIKITRNLHQALVGLRLPYQTRYIWVDAACINQEDDQERSRHVKLMRRIYKSAKRVVIWLGPDTRRKAYMAFATLCGVASGGHVNGIPVGQANFYTQGVSTANIPDVPCRDGPPPLSFKAFWTGVQELFNKSWFWRLWCIQEVSVAREAHIIWGNESIAWQHVGLAAARIRTDMSDVLQEYPMDGIFNAYFMYRISHGSVNLPPLIFSFPRLLALTRQFESTDARDRVYGLLGIRTIDANPDKGEFFIQPNYEKSAQQIYIELAAKAITSEGNLSLLSSIQHTESPSADLNSIDLASWAPNWDKSVTHTLTPTDPGPTATPLTPGVSYKLQITPHNELIVSGHVYAPVSHVSEPYTSSTPTVPTYIPNEPAWTTQLLYIEGLARLAMTLTAGKTWYGLTVQDVMRQTADFVAYAARTGILTGVEVPEEADWQRFAQASKHACTGRRPFSMSLDETLGFWGCGIGPAAMAVRDVVGVLYGFDLPVILRHVEGDKYRFVGECYVHDLMNERAIEILGKNLVTIALI
jgi:Heterokaryon incompatibility protein (HET)